MVCFTSDFSSTSELWRKGLYIRGLGNCPPGGYKRSRSQTNYSKHPFELLAFLKWLKRTKPLPPAYGRFLLETFGSGMSINVLYYPQLKVKSVITIASGVWIIMARNTVIPSPSPTFRPVSEPGPCHPRESWLKPVKPLIGKSLMQAMAFNTFNGPMTTIIGLSEHPSPARSFFEN